MGLTIHYSIRSQTRSHSQAQRQVEAMRELALDLPFEEVAEICVLGPEVCQKPFDELREDDDVFYAVCNATRSLIQCPWGNKRQILYSCQPTYVFSFSTVPGPGSEWACFGLARYPAEMTVSYRPEEDDRFTQIAENGGMRSTEFDHDKWRRWLERKGLSRWEAHDDPKFQEERRIKTGLTGWRYKSFCKTQYASDPACGGLPNFMRCHISLVTLLERIGKLPGVEVEIEDEGNYGPSTFSDDYREAHAEGRKPTYTWHPGKYDPQALAQEVGDWNQMMACMVGSLNDGLKSSGVASVAPITQFSNFEQLEFRGQRDHEQIGPFLKAMRDLAAQIVKEAGQ